jgi:hypothetical protein
MLPKDSLEINNLEACSCQGKEEEGFCNLNSKQIESFLQHN